MNPLTNEGFCFLDPIDRPRSSASVHEVRPSRLEPGVLQDVHREAHVPPAPRTLQPHLGHPHLRLLVLHRLEFPSHLCTLWEQRRSLHRHAPERLRSWWRRRNHHHDCRNDGRIHVHPYHLEQHVTSYPSSLLLPDHWRYRYRAHLLRRHLRQPAFIRPCYRSGSSTWHRYSRHYPFRDHPVWSDVRRPSCRKGTEVLGEPDIHSLVPFDAALGPDGVRHALGLGFVMQIGRIVLLPDPVVQTVYQGHDRHGYPGLQGPAVRQRALPAPGQLRLGDHVHHGFGPVLP